jgi:ubiquinol-cytochrome c reductase cytochrome c subunit
MSIMRHQMLRFALAALLAGVVLGHGSALAADVAKGKAAFMKYGCWQCHGIEGQGSVATSNGKTLAPDPLPWDGFSAFVRTTIGAMPPYSEKVLPNEDLQDIHAYLASIPKPADYKTIPLLNQ